MRKTLSGSVRRPERAVSDLGSDPDVGTGDTPESLLRANPGALAVAYENGEAHLVASAGSPPKWVRESRVYPRSIEAGATLIGCGWPETVFEDVVEL